MVEGQVHYHVSVIADDVEDIRPQLDEEQAKIVIDIASAKCRAHTLLTENNSE